MHCKFSLKFLVLKTLCVSLGLVGVILPAYSDAPPKRVIGIVVPMEHQALKEIIEGFKETLKGSALQGIEVLVQNAQGDMNIQRAIFQQFLNQNVDIIVPIGTAATQMALSMTEGPILSLAASSQKIDSQKQRLCPITGVQDEIGVKKQLEFLGGVVKNLKKISLIYSSSEKVFPEVEEITSLAAAQGIFVQKRMVQNLPELYAVSRSIDLDTDLIFILKDHLIVSGIRTLIQEAEKRGIPLCASDEGSVMEGAACALGVKEKEIGIQGGLLALKILEGTPLKDIPFKKVEKLSIFYNAQSLKKQKFSLEVLKKYAEKMGYTFMRAEGK